MVDSDFSVLYAASKKLLNEKKKNGPYFKTAFIKDFRFFIITSTRVTDFLAFISLLSVKIFYSFSKLEF